MRPITLSVFTIYALEQCTPELSQKGCGDCLLTAILKIPQVASRKIGCRILQPSCNLRYETIPFFAAVDVIPQPRPSSPLLSQSLPSPTEGNGNGNGSNTTRILIIVLVASVVGILSLVLCIWICLRLRKPREIVENAEVDEMIKAESSQYDLATIRAATSNFCVENKLGQGVFRAVYEGNLPKGQEVAVERLSSASGQGDLEFKNEVL
ncbi:hypothetical protein SLEP1_g29527 [Rubroshorea leprosula]|uniref:Gnk2-homologous domain-containing protein n=1 Tax=Rubroshorea leprosula TaxID=152421 RepID=A0AAV5K8L8_9ROSI|nr:hypothetical protein SLEP1_g29527 [Rubroshorea leprosula]